MRRADNKIYRFLACEDGPTAVEYAIMLALIILVCIASIRVLGTSTSARFLEVSNALT